MRQSRALMPLVRDLVACLCFALLVVAIVVERQARSGDLSGRSLFDSRHPWGLVGVESGKCVAAPANPAPGAALQISSCNGGPSQRFDLEPRSGRTYRLRNVATGMCVDVKGADEKPGAPVILYPCHQDANQRWAFTRVSPYVYELYVLHSDQQLDVKAGSVEDGAELQQWYESHSQNQRFRLVR